MENQWVCMTFVWILNLIVFAPAYLGLVLSLRDVEFSAGTHCDGRERDSEHDKIVGALDALNVLSALSALNVLVVVA